MSEGSRKDAPILGMIHVEDMTMEDATLLAASYAHHDAEVKRIEADMEKQRDLLEQWMAFNGATELVDEETGLGVRYGKPAKGTPTWDTMSMPDSMVLQLKALNLLTVQNKSFDAMRAANDALVLHDAQPYRQEKLNNAPFQVVKGDRR